jgi:hypothetical protein
MQPDAAASSTGFEENNGINGDLENPPRRGLSPQTPPLDYTPTWGSFSPSGAGETKRIWKSTPITATLGDWLKFETAGNPGADGNSVRLELCDATTGKVLTTVAPTKVPGNSWRAAYVHAPRVPFVVVATDNSAAEWLAFGAPVEMSHASFIAWQATKHGLLILWIATALTLAMGVGCVVQRRSTPPTSAPVSPRTTVAH